MLAAPDPHARDFVSRKRCSIFTVDEDCQVLGASQTEARLRANNESRHQERSKSEGSDYQNAYGISECQSNQCNALPLQTKATLGVSGGKSGFA
jgi:hypothetical protein